MAALKALVTLIVVKEAIAEVEMEVVATCEAAQRLSTPAMGELELSLRCVLKSHRLLRLRMPRGANFLFLF